MIELRAGDAALAIDVDRGARWSSVRVEGDEMLVGPPDDSDRSIYWGCFLMAPWAGRMEDATLDWEGARHHLRANDGPHAIHGLVFDRTWSVERATAREAEVSCELGADGWPFGGHVRQRVRLWPGRLLAEADIIAGSCPMPAALGWHPWFAAGDGSVRLVVSATEVLETRELIPTGRRCPVDSVTDLRGGPSIVGRELDHAYPDAASPALVRWPGRELAIAFDSPLRTLVVHSRPGSFCVEPQTAWPNAAALAARGVDGTGLATLAPGTRLHASMRWQWRPSVRDTAAPGAALRTGRDAATGA